MDAKSGAFKSSFGYVLAISTSEQIACPRDCHFWQRPLKPVLA